MAEAVSIPYIASGLINLGPDNPSAIKRLANYAQTIINSGQPIPESPFVEWAADRVTGSDRQDLVFFLQGRRGSGKSYSFLYLGKRLGEAIARRVGGTWEDYFSLNNCTVLEDTDSVLRLLSTTGKHQIVLVDDCSLAISNRSWNSQENRNFNALLTVCRTNRWILLLTAPLKKHVDNQVREMCDLTGMVFKPFHKGGFNILKVTSSEISTSGKEYNHRMNFSKKRVRFWVTFKPDPVLTFGYDKQRDASGRTVNERILSTGTYKSSGKKPSLSLKTTAERNADVVIEKHGDAIRKTVMANPDISLNRLSALHGMSFSKMQRVCLQMGLNVGQYRAKKATTPVQTTAGVVAAVATVLGGSGK